MNGPVDIKEIIELVRQQAPDRQDIIIALQNASGGRWDGNGYYRFVDSVDANKPGAEWQFCENVVLEGASWGDIVLDILKDGRIGGIEFTGLIDA